MEQKCVEHCCRLRDETRRGGNSDSHSKKPEEEALKPGHRNTAHLNRKNLKIKTSLRVSSRTDSRSINRGTFDTDESRISEYFSPNLPKPKRSSPKRLAPLARDCSLEAECEGPFMNHKDAEGVTRASLAHLKSKFSMYAKEESDPKLHCVSISPVASIKPGLLSQLKQLKNIVQSSTTFEVEPQSRQLPELSRPASPQKLKIIRPTQPNLLDEKKFSEKPLNTKNLKLSINKLKVDVEQLSRTEEFRLRRNTPRSSDAENKGYLLQRTPQKRSEGHSDLILASTQNQESAGPSAIPHESKVSDGIQLRTVNGVSYPSNSLGSDDRAGELLATYLNQVGKSKPVASNGVNPKQKASLNRLGSLVPIACTAITDGDREASVDRRAERTVDQGAQRNQAQQLFNKRVVGVEAETVRSISSSRKISNPAVCLQVTKLKSLSYFASRFALSDQNNTEGSQSKEQQNFQQASFFEGAFEKDTAQATQRTEEPNFAEYSSPSFRNVPQRDSVLDAHPSKPRKQAARLGPSDQGCPLPLVRKVAEKLKDSARGIRIEVTPASDQKAGPADAGRPGVALEEQRQKPEESQHLSFANFNKRDDCSEMVLLNQNESRLPNQNTSKNSGRDGLLSSVNQRSLKEDEKNAAKFKSVPFQLIRNRKNFLKEQENSKVAHSEEADRPVFKKSKSMNQLTSVRPKPKANQRDSPDNSLVDVEPEENLAALKIRAFKDDMALSSLKMNTRAKHLVDKPKRKDSELEQVYYTDSSVEENLQKVQNLPHEQSDANFGASPFKSGQQPSAAREPGHLPDSKPNKNQASFQKAQPAAASRIKFDLRRISESSINPSKNHTVSDYRRSKETGSSFNRLRGAIQLQLSRRSENETYREGSVSGWRRSNGGTSGKYVTESYES